MAVAVGMSHSMYATRSLDDMDAAALSIEASSHSFSRSQSQRGSRKSLGSLGSAEELIKVAEIEHKDPFKSFTNTGWTPDGCPEDHTCDDLETSEELDQLEHGYGDQLE